MTDMQKIQAILAAIQTDSQLMLLLRTMITNNIVNVPSANLDAMMIVLGLTQTPPVGP